VHAIRRSGSHMVLNCLAGPNRNIVLYWPHAPTLYKIFKRNHKTLNSKHDNFLYRNHKMLRISNVLKTLVSKQQPYHCQKKMSITYKSLEHTSCWMQHISCWMAEFGDDVQMKWLFLTLNSDRWLLFFWFISFKKPSCASWELERGKDRHPMCKSF
jgi:hypothetical protein